MGWFEAPVRVCSPHVLVVVADQRQAEGSLR
jgi:hypothetical protein